MVAFPTVERLQIQIYLEETNLVTPILMPDCYACVFMYICTSFSKVALFLWNGNNNPKLLQTDSFQHFIYVITVLLYFFFWEAVYRNPNNVKNINTCEVNIGIFLYACNNSVTNLTVSLSFDLQNFTFLYESAWLFKKTASRCISPFCFLLHSYMFNFQYLIYPVKSGKQIIYGLISC